MNIADLPEDSDTSDEDYTPSGNQDDPLSEVESDGDSEEPLCDTAGDVIGKKRKKKTTKSKKKIKAESQESGGSSKENDNQHEETEEDKKKKVDDLWADFMKDTGFKPKNSNNKKIDLNISQAKEKNENKGSLPSRPVLQKSSEKVKVTQIFEFAGEEVRVEKEVCADSAEARLLHKTSNIEPATPSKAKQGGGLSGISNVLSQLGKKPKISTLEKTKLDWDKFKREENIEEELQIYNKGKDGYLDRQDFLQRADQRRFEIEKDLRTIERNKRFNSTL